MTPGRTFAILLQRHSHKGCRSVGPLEEGESKESLFCVLLRVASSVPFVQFNQMLRAEMIRECHFPGVKTGIL